MQLDVLVVMDSIATIQITKDTTFAMLLEAQRRGHRLYYICPGGLSLHDGCAYASAARLEVFDDLNSWYTLSSTSQFRLGAGQVILMRKEPPVDAEFIHTTQLLSIAQDAGAQVVNAPSGLRDYNEKIAAQLFPQCCPPTIVSSNRSALKTFVHEQAHAVLKPLDGMGGRSIFSCRDQDPNLNVILDLLTQGSQKMVMAQRYLPEIIDGDKRILLIDGQPVDYCLARIPQGDEFRGNLAAGGRAEGRPLTNRDRWIANQIGPRLRASGMRFVGIDVIGDYLTEINVTSPTCVRELDRQFELNIAGQLFDAIEAEL